MDRRPRECGIPDASRIPIGNSPGDRRPVEMTTKAWIPWAAARAIESDGFGVVMAWALEEKRSEEISTNQPESGMLQEDAEAAEQETPPHPPKPLPPQQSLAAHPLALLSPPEEVGGDELEGVMVSENMVVEIGGVMACDGGKGMMESMQMDKEEELLQQQPNQQQPQLPGAADLDP